MSYKVVRNAQGEAIAFGPNDNNYEPAVSTGCVLSIEQTVPQMRVSLVSSAKQELDKTDLVCLRCYKANVTYPVEWQKYTADLRKIVNGTDITSTTLPTRPAYPAGT